MDSLQLNINVSFKQLVEVVKQLSPAEKDILNEAMWNESMVIPAEHQALVNARIEKSIQEPERILDWDAASKTLLQ